MATRIFPADRAFSNFIRERDGWTCQRCGREYPPPTSALHNSHFFSRGKWSTRFDPENCMALCYGCHRFMDKHIESEYKPFKIERIGEDAFSALSIRAYTPGKSNYWKTMSYKEATELFANYSRG
jgi:hypothetical protein